LKKKSCLTQYNTSDTQSNLSLNISEYAVLNKHKRKIGILGGTFNPIHSGHVKMGIDAHDEFSLSKVLYIPTSRPPHKDNTIIARDVDRLSMLDLALSEPYMQICDVELNRIGVTYTIDTLNELKKIYANDEFYYIIGSDTLFTLDSWKNFYDVLTLTNFIVFLRDNEDMKKIKLCMDFYNSMGKKRICLASNPGLLISSSMIRDNIKTDLNLSELLPKPVINYIKENKLYT